MYVSLDLKAKMDSCWVGSELYCPPRYTMESKLCTKCNTEKPLAEMVKRGDTHKSECKSCKNAAGREKLKTNSEYREKERMRGKAKYQRDKEKHCAITKRYYQENLEWRKDLHLQKTYGITMDTKLKMREEQDNKCAICKEEFENDKSAYVDHCHTTGKVRGLLCHMCNSGLGMFRDSHDIIVRALEYNKMHG